MTAATDTAAATGWWPEAGRERLAGVERELAAARARLAREAGGDPREEARLRTRLEALVLLREHLRRQLPDAGA